MTIAITLPDAFEIENYEGLRTFLIDHLEIPSGTQAQLANLIRLAELRLARKITSTGREATTTLATIPGTQTVSLPSDFSQMRQLRISGDPSYPLEPVTLNTVETMDHSGKPLVYAMHAGKIVLGPNPDAVYTLSLRYQAGLTPLTDNSQTNWLLVEHADAYVYMSAALICQHLSDPDNATLYFNFADAVIDEINEQGNRRRNAQPMRLRSSVVV